MCQNKVKSILVHRSLSGPTHGQKIVAHILQADVITGALGFVWLLSVFHRFYLEFGKRNWLAIEWAGLLFSESGFIIAVENEFITDT